jgi:hypothetical protein
VSSHLQYAPDTGVGPFTAYILSRTMACQAALVVLSVGMPLALRQFAIDGGDV